MSRYASDSPLGGNTLVLGGGGGLQNSQGMLGGGPLGHMSHLAAQARRQPPNPVQQLGNATQQPLANVSGVQQALQQAKQANTPLTLRDLVLQLATAVKSAEVVNNSGATRSAVRPRGNNNQNTSSAQQPLSPTVALDGVKPLFSSSTHTQKYAGMMPPTTAPQLPPPPLSGPTQGPGMLPPPPPPQGAPPPPPGMPPPPQGAPPPPGMPPQGGGGGGMPPPQQPPMPGQPLAPGQPPPGQPLPGTSPPDPPPPPVQHRRQDISGSVMGLLNQKNAPITGMEATDSMNDANFAMGKEGRYMTPLRFLNPKTSLKIASLRSTASMYKSADITNATVAQPMHPAAMAALAGLHGGIGGLEAGALLGGGYGYGQGDTWKGIGRGALRGTLTGGGAGTGAILGVMAGKSLGGAGAGGAGLGIAGALAGAGLGGLGGWKATNLIAGKGHNYPADREQRRREVAALLADKLKTGFDLFAYVLNAKQEKTAAIKRALQDNDGPQRSATGDSTNLSYQHKPDHYLQGLEAWQSAGHYLKHKPKDEPNPFKGQHKGMNKDSVDYGMLKTALGGSGSRSAAPNSSSQHRTRQRASQASQTASSQSVQQPQPQQQQPQVKQPTIQKSQPTQITQPNRQQPGQQPGMGQVPQQPVQQNMQQVPQPPTPMGQPLPQQTAVAVPVPVPTRAPSTREMVDYGQPSVQKQLTHGLGGGGQNSMQQQAVTRQSQPTMHRATQTAPASPHARALATPGNSKTGFDKLATDPTFMMALASFVSEGNVLLSMGR